MQCVVFSGTGKLVALRVRCEGFQAVIGRVEPVIGRSYPANIRTGCRLHFLFSLFHFFFMVSTIRKHYTWVNERKGGGLRDCGERVKETSNLSKGEEVSHKRDIGKE